MPKDKIRVVIKNNIPFIGKLNQKPVQYIKIHKISITTNKARLSKLITESVEHARITEFEEIIPHFYKQAFPFLTIGSASIIK